MCYFCACSCHALDCHTCYLLSVATRAGFQVADDVWLAYDVQFYSPKGKVKATLRFKGYNSLFGRAVSQDGR